MKRVDPGIKLVASGVSLWEDYPLPDFKSCKTELVERAQLVLEQAGDRIDYMAIHRYANPYNDDPFENYMAFAQDYHEHLTAYEGLIQAVSLERGIKHAIGIAVDEWGLTRFQAAGDAPVIVDVDKCGYTRINPQQDAPRVRRRRIINLEDALVTALHLNTFIRHAAAVRIANFHRIPRIGNNLKGPESPVLLPAMFYPFELYSRKCGQLALDVFCNGDTFSGVYGNRRYSGIRTLDVAATLDKAQKQLAVFVVNQSKDKALEASITLTSGEFSGNVSVVVVNGPDIKSENSDEKPNQVGVKETGMKVSGKSFSYTFEPHSVTALICAVK
jgi:alpha-L-arabinofuranosidase